MSKERFNRADKYFQKDKDRILDNSTYEAYFQGFYDGEFSTQVLDEKEQTRIRRALMYINHIINDAEMSGGTTCNENYTIRDVLMRAHKAV